MAVRFNISFFTLDVDQTNTDGSGEEIMDRLAFSVFCDVERALFDVESGVGGDSHRLENSGMQIANADWVFDG